MTHLQELADEKLVQLYRSGNNEAFDVLLSRYKDRLYSYILCAVHNPDVADDLFQETFVRAIMTIRQGRYREDGKFYAWLTRISHNLIVDQFRAENNMNCITPQEGEVDIFNLQRFATDSVESGIVTRQISSDVRRLVRNLPQTQREVVLMRFYQGLSFKEISQRTGVGINTALGRMHYALQNMRRMAKEHDVQLTL
ncbi:MAG: sigma-70 family RNA polymerase sigma factor [Alloprevotella sp.]|nr:sigma-70 family RNA polymerase sigma factor [Alloprevotella sp.]